MLIITDTPQTPLLDSLDTPPDIIHHLTLCLTGKTKTFPIPRRHDHGELGRVHPFQHLQVLCDIYADLSGGSAGIVIFKAHETINKVIRHGLSTQWIQSLSFGVAMPIMEALRLCQLHPSKTWSSEVYAFVGRPDYAAKNGKVADDNAAATSVSLLYRHPAYIQANDKQPTIAQLMSLPNAEKPADFSRPNVRFGSDRRVPEVERILQTTRVRTMSIEPPKGLSEQDLTQYHQSVVNTIANRTLSITVASGVFEYGTRRTTVTDAWEIAPIELSVKILPVNTVLKAQLMAENADWPCFHNGVSAALAISPECKGIDSSWIVFNRPHALNSEHGGFLLGLGLNGHLRSLMAYHAYPYMEPRHDYTSCGLLLGLACSFAGSQDQLCNRILSLHTHALLPLGSAELNASPTIQSSALMGLGLVHAGSRNLRIAEVILSEIGRQKLPGVDAFEGYQEAYSFSASMAFGLIMLGRGGNQSSEIDRRLLAKLRRCIIGEAVGADAIDTTMTAPGATLALGLMYLKTGQRDVAAVLEIPQSAFDADHVRPDMLLLRVLSRSLIMWDDINASLTWIEDQLPPYLQKAHKGHRKTSTMDIASELAYFYIIAGACFAVGLKLAGTGSELAHNNLIFFFGMLSRACGGSSMTYEGRLRRHAARQCLNTVTLALAAVMSGSGELNVLRRLRVSHGQEGAGVTYGTHMANHMACGILFLGRGDYTLGNSNLAIAVLSIAFFPRFQPSPSDNKAYPQAFRHLWALAAEPRCLSARDVDTNETVYLPIRLRAKGGLQAPQSHISPTLIAPFDTLKSIETESPRYWPIIYDLMDPKDKQAILRQRTLFVKRKAAYLDYNTDPKGNRSMILRAGSISGFDTHYDLLAAAAPPALPATEIEDLLIVHSGSPELVGMVQCFAGDSPFDQFVRNVLLECVSHDKPSVIGAYLAMWLALHGQSRLQAEHMAQLQMMREFYSPATFANYTVASTSPERRLGWIRINFLLSATRKIADVDIGEDVLEAYFAKEEWSPLLAIYLAKNHVPPLEFLRAVKKLVMRSGGTDLEALEAKVRDAAKGYAQAVQRRYIPEEVEQTVKVWKAASVTEVVRIWLNEHEAEL
jgi:anaphase-promoting complex subunit 1